MISRTRAFAVICAVITLALCPGAVAQTTWHVDDDAPNDPGPNDATVSDPLEDGSADHPFDAILEAIAVAQNGDEVLVAEGIYAGVGNVNLDFAGKAITVRGAGGDPSACVIEGQTWEQGFIFQNGETAASAVDGLTVRNVYGFYGGGVLCLDGSPTIKNCIFSGNSACYDGGGVYCESQSSPTFENCIIEGNVADYGSGGGVACRSGCNPIFIGCALRGNSTRDYGEGGGLCLMYSSSATLNNCIISDNHTFESGGGVAATDNSNLTLRDCIIQENTAEYGGGFYSYESSPTFERCIVERNFANSIGGGVACGRGDPMVNHCLILRNQAYYYGGGVCIENCNATIGNSTFAWNYTFFYGGSLFYDSGSVSIDDCILWGNGSPALHVYNVDPVVSYCNVQGGWPGTGNIDADPLLAPDGHLRSGSPCLNAGDPGNQHVGQTDIDGEPRLINGRADIGADEWLDAEGDGLPDWWETLHFQNATAANPLIDEEGDGRSNLTEYGGGTDPFVGPRSFYVDPTGDDDWDGRTPTWDGTHGPKATIRAALDLTHPLEGDEVVIADGIYSGPGNRNLDFAGKAVAVRGVDGDPTECVIDCERGGRAFSFHNGETGAAILAGLTIRNGFDVDSGGVYCAYNSSPTLSNCVVVGCAADDYNGGAIGCFYDASPTLNNCAIIGNRANYNGGGVYCLGYGNPTLNNCTISGNDTVLNGGGVYCGFDSSPKLYNCVLWSNTPQAIHVYSGDPAVEYSNVQGGWTGTGNISAVPRFVRLPDDGGDGWGDDPDTPDVDEGLNDDFGDLHLLSGSPCIDAGGNDWVPPDTADLDNDGDTAEPLPLDLADVLRFRDDVGMIDRGDAGSTGLPVVDMGAYEFQDQTCLGDLTGDNLINLRDLAQLLGHYGMTTGAFYADGDLNADGDVDLNDLAALLSRYGAACP